MNRSQHRSTRTLVVATLLAATSGLVAGPAGARPYDGDPAPQIVRAPGGCELEKLGTQLVRCDDLTGNGVPAPAGIAEQ